MIDLEKIQKSLIERNKRLQIQLVCDHNFVVVNRGEQKEYRNEFHVAVVGFWMKYTCDKCKLSTFDVELMSPVEIKEFKKNNENLKIAC